MNYSSKNMSTRRKVMLTKKIFPTIVVIIFLISNFGYTQSDSLRVPVGTQEVKKRQQDVQRQLFLEKYGEEFAIASLNDSKLAQLITMQQSKRDSSTLSNLRKYLQENPDAFGRESVEGILATFSAWCATTRYYYSGQGESQDLSTYLRNLAEFTAELLSRKGGLIKEGDLRTVVDTILGARPEKLVVYTTFAEQYLSVSQGDGRLPDKIDKYTPWLGFLKYRNYLVRKFAQGVAQHPSAIIGTKEKLKNLIIFLNEKALPEERAILISALYPIFEASFDSMYASNWDKETVGLIIGEKKDKRLEVKPGWEPVFDLVKQKQSFLIAEALPENAKVSVPTVTHTFSRTTLINAVKKGYISYNFESKVWANNVNDCLPMDILIGMANFTSDSNKKVRAQELIANLESDLGPETIENAEAFIEGLSKEEKDLRYRYYGNKMDKVGDKMYVLVYWRYGPPYLSPNIDRGLYLYIRYLQRRLDLRDSLAVTETRRLYASLNPNYNPEVHGKEKAKKYDIKDKLYSPEIVTEVLYTLQNTSQKKLRELGSGV